MYWSPDKPIAKQTQPKDQRNMTIALKKHQARKKTKIFLLPDAAKSTDSFFEVSLYINIAH